MQQLQSKERVIARILATVEISIQLAQSRAVHIPGAIDFKTWTQSDETT